MGWEWILLPLVGSLIGWFTNFLAIRMLFRPKVPRRLVGRMSIQGVLPRRRDDLARVVAETVEKDLLPIDELLERVDMAGYEAEVVDAVVSHVDRRLGESLPEALPAQFKRMLVGYVRRIVEREAGAVVRHLSARIAARVRSDLQVGRLVHEKMAALDTDELERIVVRVAGHELRAIEVLGALLGGAIGLAQAALLALL